jgi:hypothetical protein
LITNGGSNDRIYFLLFQNGMDILLTFLNCHHPLLKVVIAIIQSHYKIFGDSTKRINLKLKFVSITKNILIQKGSFNYKKTSFYSKWWVKCQKSFLLFQNEMNNLLTFLNCHHPLLKVTIAIVQSHYKIFRGGRNRINLKLKFVSITKKF